MTQVLLIIHLIVTICMIGLILLQRSEGGGLGIGGGNGGLGSFAGPRATANILSRATMFCFAAFVALSLLLAILANGAGNGSGVINKLDASVPAITTPAAPVVPNVPVSDDEANIPTSPEPGPVAPVPATAAEPVKTPTKPDVPVQ